MGVWNGGGSLRRRREKHVFSYMAGNRRSFCPSPLRRLIACHGRHRGTRQAFSGITAGIEGGFELANGVGRESHPSV